MSTRKKPATATSQRKFRDIHPKKNPSGGKKAGGHGKQKPVEYLKVDLKEVFVTSVNTAP